MGARQPNGVLRAMDIRPRPPTLEFEFGFGFQLTIEPSLAALERVKVEQEAAHLAGEVFVDYPLAVEDLDVVVRKVYAAKRNTNIQLAGGLVPQAAMRMDEVDRRPYAELADRAREAFANAERAREGQ